MATIAFPLKLNMKRPAVGELHQALALIGLEVAAADKDNQRFGTSTREAVRKFQANHQLAVTGVVDEATANLLNRLLAERGALDAEVTYAVKGMVRTADGAPAAGLTVQSFDRDVSREELLGSAVSNAEGGYEIRFAEAQFKHTAAERGGLAVAPWHLNVDEAVRWIEEGYQFVVPGNQPRRLVIVRHIGPVQLRAAGDEGRGNELLSLLSIPAHTPNRQEAER